MVYIYKKTIGGNPYYYLRVSERKGSRIIAKDIAYLGSSIKEVKNSLNDLPKFKEDIRKAYKTIQHFLESNHYAEKAKKLKLKSNLFLGDKLINVESCRLHYQDVFLKKDALTQKEIIKNFIVDFAFNTTSIEGNTIKLEQARNLLEEGLTPENKTLREIYDIQNTEKVFFYLMESNKDLSHEFIIKIHSDLMNNIDARIGYRLSDVHVFKSNFKASPFPYIKTDIDILLKWYEQNRKKLHPLVLATIFHHKFEKIHPFMDGNGRTGRMLLNFILMKAEYPPIIIHKKLRAYYLISLRKADNSDLTHFRDTDYSDLVQFTADEMINSYWNLFL